MTKGKCIDSHNICPLESQYTQNDNLYNYVITVWENKYTSTNISVHWVEHILTSSRTKQVLFTSFILLGRFYCREIVVS